MRVIVQRAKVQSDNISCLDTLIETYRGLFSPDPTLENVPFVSFTGLDLLTETKIGTLAQSFRHYVKKTYPLTFHKYLLLM